jgi:NADH-quinone oxidoreductase subunit N
VTDAIEQIHATVLLLVPELILLTTMCVLFLAGPMLVTDSGNAPPGLRNQWGFLSLMTLAIAWFIWFSGPRIPPHSDGALFQIDHLVWYTRGLTLSAGIVLALVLWNQIDDGHAAEAHACLLAIITGTNLVAAADDLVSLFLALELVSIPTYVLLYLPRRDRPGREATVKYFLLSAFSSALVLYGMSWLYGVAGSTNFAAIGEQLGQVTSAADVWLPRVALAFLIAGLSFRIAAVPFHFYAPDVFQGTTPSNAALLSFVPKVVGFVALLRVLPLLPSPQLVASWAPEHSLQLLLASIAILTMFVGNLMAWRQTNLYRLLAYSSVAHAGYMLIGLTVGDTGAVPGTQALLFYLAAYGLMTIGVIALISGWSGIGRGSGGGQVINGAYTTLTDIRGLSRLHPTTALCLAVCLLSLTGLPPTVGFFGKLNLFFAAWNDATTLGRTLAIILAINAAIGAWYYLRIVAVMFLDPMPEQAPPRTRPAWSSFLAGAICTAGTVLFFVAPQWLWDALP